MGWPNNIRKMSEEITFALMELLNILKDNRSKVKES